MSSAYAQIHGSSEREIIVQNYIRTEISIEQIYFKDWYLYEGPCECILLGQDCSSIEYCIHKRSLVECTESCSPRCKNKEVQSGNWFPDLKLKCIPKEGNVVVTEREIPPATFLCEYVGEIISSQEFQTRRKVENAYKMSGHSMTMGNGFIIDTNNKCGIGGFMKSSCLPNCEVKMITVEGIPRMTIWSKNEFIFPGSQLCYGFNRLNDPSAQNFVCQCGQYKCIAYVHKAPKTTKRKCPQQTLDTWIKRD